MSQELSLMLDAAMGRYRAADAAGDADGRAQAHRDMTEIVAAMRIGQNSLTVERGPKVVPHE